MNNTLYLPVEIKSDNDLPKKPGWYACIDPNSIPERNELCMLRLGSNQQWYNENNDGEHPSYWLKPLSLEEVGDYLAGVQGNDLASVASHTCTAGNSIEQEAIEFFEYAKESDLYWDWKWAKERLNLKENE